MGNCNDRPDDAMERDTTAYAKNDDRRTNALKEYRQSLMKQDFRKSLRDGKFPKKCGY